MSIKHQSLHLLHRSVSHGVHCRQLHAPALAAKVVSAGNQVKEELRNRMPPSFTLTVTPLSESLLCLLPW